ncbi:MAG: radical SAM family heme chaperone HemW [Candidatus Thiodiazotropha sp. (ex. Lucinoma kazani)]
MIQPPPLSLYIHIPWCVRKCPYCDFNSHAMREVIDEGIYVEALLKDLYIDRELVGERPIETIFMGGGTPSLFSSDAIGQLLKGVQELVDFSDQVEITLEANPGTLEAEQFPGYRDVGINRLSLGVQSLNADSLRALGRIHGTQEVYAAVGRAKRAGFEHINLDMMFGLPQQTLDMAQSDLVSAIALETGHLSYYQLTLEPNTPFHQSPPHLPDEEILWQMQRQGQMMLEKVGFSQYEVSAFARQGERCKHNLNYWRFGDYVGIGAGAHGKLTTVDGVIKRRWKRRHPNDYLAATVDSKGFTQGDRTLQPEDLLIEFMMNALRLREGVESELFHATTGLPLAAITELLERAVDKGLLLPDSERLCPSPLGRRFLNDLLEIFEVKRFS